MKLQECVQNIEIGSEKFIHIGSCCGFFFVGTKEEYEEKIDEISNEYKNKLKSKMRQCEKRIKERTSNFITDVQISNLPKANTDKIDAYCDALAELLKITERKINKRIKAINDSYNSYNDCKYKLRNWIDFRDREVKETYKRISGDGIVIIIDGDEMGAAWNRKEFLYGSSEDEEE